MSTLSELLPAGGGGQNQVEFTASGTLPNGKPVILKADGTVEVVEETSTSVSESIPAGSEAVFNSASTEYSSVSFDPNTSGKFVVCYRDAGNSYYGTACVGTISGTSISFGSEYVFNSAGTTDITADFDPNNSGKFVVCYRDGGNYNKGSACVGTVSGTSISFGIEYIFHINSTYISAAFDPNTSGKFVVCYRDADNAYIGKATVGSVSGTSISFGSSYTFASGGVKRSSVAFDPNNSGKFVVCYRDTGNSSYGTGRVGTVSGDTISFGSAVLFSMATQYPSVSFDPNTSGKFVVCYKDTGNSYYGTACVGTVSGTSVSFGSEVVFNSGDTIHISAAFDPNNSGKFVVCYSDAASGEYGKAIVGTVSGTSISFGSEVQFNAKTSYISAAFDPNTSGKFVVCYSDEGNSFYGTAILGQMGYTNTTTNLTASNLLGISAEAAASGATAKIDTWGGLNESQSSLTIGSDYYVQTDGTLSTTSTAPAQQIGKAISATTINMRDLT